jgi:hypothetical protein
MSEIISSGITLTIPTLGETNWDQVIKTLCFQKISEHDHTGGGKGNQIGTNAIANLAITTGKIADLGVTGAKIADATIATGKLDADAASRSCLLFESRISTTGGTTAIAEMVRLGGSSTTRIRMPRAGKVTFISVQSQTGKTSGTLTITLYKNGATTSKTFVMPNAESGTGAITAESFVAGDTLSLAITNASTVFTSPPADLICTAWGHFS